MLLFCSEAANILLIGVLYIFTLFTEPLGVLILERFHVQPEGFESASAFSIIFDNESGPKQHLFVAENERRAKQWQTALKNASYQYLREKLINLQITLRQKTGCDPLRGEIFSFTKMYMEIEGYVFEI